jgi:hypothetical protein
MKRNNPSGWMNQLENRPDLLHDRIAELRGELINANPAILASYTGSKYSDTGNGNGEFQTRIWDRDINISYPDFTMRDTITGMEPPPLVQALLLYYFCTSDGTPEAKRWISFRDLPGGQFYAQAYQGYTGKEIARAFQDDLAAFSQAAERLGGRRETMGDVAYAFRVLPHVSLLCVYWSGDEDLPSSCQVLFDAASGHHLPTDACAILGSDLTRKLKKQGS